MVDADWTFTVEAAPSIVIDVVDISSLELVATITNDAFEVFVGDEDETIAIDLNGPLVECVHWNLIVMEYGSFVVSFAGPSVLDVVGDLVVGKSEVYPGAADWTFDVGAGAGIVINTVPASCLDLVGSITDNFFEDFVVVTDEGIVSDINGAFTVDLVWNIVSDEYRDFVVSIDGVSVL